MKRIILIGIAVTLISAFACRKPVEVIETPSLPTNEPAVSEAPSSTATDIPITAEPTIMPTAAYVENGMPPMRPVFYSTEEYLLLASSVDLDDAECEKFLSDIFLGSGIRTKADAVKTMELINSMPFPAADGLELIYADLQYWNNTFSILYRVNGEIGRFVAFDIFLTSSDGEAERKDAEQANSLVELPEMRSSELKFLARVPFDPAYPRFVTNIRSHKMQLDTSLSEKELVDILANCEFITMDEYAKKAAP